MKKILFALPALVVLYFGVRTARYALASDETRILWLLEQMEEAYNEGQAGRAVAPLDKDWRHQDLAYDKEDLRIGVFNIGREERDSDGERTSRVTLDDDGLTIAVTGDGATVAAPVAFARREDGQWSDEWKAVVHADLARQDGGWRIVSSRHDDVEGTYLSR